MKTLFVIFAIISVAKSQNISNFPNEINQLISDNFIWEIIVNTIISNVQDYVNTIPKNNECMRQLNLFFDALPNGEKWALEMLDATAKLQSGILYGNVMHVGNYDECLQVGVNVNESEINGKYCTVYYDDDPDNSIKDVRIDAETLRKLRFSIGLCLPAACTEEFIQPIISDLINNTYVPGKLDFNERFCTWNDNYQLSTREIVGICIFGFFAVIVVLSTLYDVIIFQKHGKSSKLLIAFSFYSNGKQLFSTKKSDDSLHCLNGIRVISMLWIVLGHRCLYSTFLPLVNVSEYLKWLDRRENMFILGASMAVDTFFTISGLLIMYIFLKNKHNGKHISLGIFYIHRILRLTPSLIMVIVLTITLFGSMGSGPFWIAHDFFVKHCEDNWWSTLLYVQNYVNPENACVGQSWYLAVDTQLFFFSPLILIPIMRWPKSTIFVLLLVASVSCGMAFEITWRFNHQASFLVFDTELLKDVYNPTHLRLTPWAFGMICGYVIFKCKDKSIKMNKILVLFLWIISISTLVGIILFHHRVANYNAGEDLPIMERSLFNSLARPIWSLALCIIIFACVTGHGGFINKFLSCTIFNVLIRVNYSMYLLHLVVIMYFIGQNRTPNYVSNITVFHEFWGDLFYTLIVSFIWTLTFESPIIVLEKFIFGKTKKDDSSIGNVNKNNVTDVIVTISS